MAPRGAQLSMLGVLEAMSVDMKAAAWASLRHGAALNLVASGCMLGLGVGVGVANIVTSMVLRRMQHEDEAPVQLPIVWKGVAVGILGICCTYGARAGYGAASAWQAATAPR